MSWERAEQIRKETMSSDTQAKATRSQQAAERLMEFYLPSMSQAMMAYEIHGFYVDLEASHDKLLGALKSALSPLRSLILVAPGTMPAVLGAEAIAQAEAAIKSAEEEPNA